MTSSGGWASEVSRPPWRARFDAAEREWGIHDDHGRVVGYFNQRRDAEFVCACVNGELGNQKAMTVRWVAKDVWLGTCNYCQPTYLLLGNASMQTLGMLQDHFRNRHVPDQPDQTSQEIDLR